MKQVKLYYTERDRLYAEKEAYVIENAGISLEKIDANTLPNKIKTPAFVVFKNNRFLAKLEGKHNPGVILSWIKTYIKDEE